MFGLFDQYCQKLRWTWSQFCKCSLFEKQIERHNPGVVSHFSHLSIEIWTALSIFSPLTVHIARESQLHIYNVGFQKLWVQKNKTTSTFKNSMSYGKVQRLPLLWFWTQKEENQGHLKQGIGGWYHIVLRCPAPVPLRPSWAKRPFPFMSLFYAQP